ncbi:N-acetylneuraminate synthase family protein [Gammaproteobacteria bacterium]|jgi:sialic acid synthase SpsE|nr:N-acetylneuraminate synthase family protein [Gammaproteobacteria bacterium]MDC0128954.1 N-acetylneuraminate synthase family protein [Gammaproteobacteria bacterium]
MTFFIAEVSSNHSKDIKRALEFVDAAAASGCDAVKFQLFQIEKLFAPEILAKSEKHRLRKDWELSLDFLPILAQRCRVKNIQFSCTPFYLGAVAELQPYVDFYKVASYELLWDDLLIACARTGKPVIISTGMANLEEIKHAVETLRNNKCEPTVLHCTSAYPTPFNEANLSAIETIRNTINCDVGWSDHTVNPGIIHRAIHKWDAQVVEFHLDLDGKGDEFKSGHCWLPEQISPVIKQVREAMNGDGDGIKEPVPSEIPDLLWRADPSDGLRPFKSIRNSANLIIK